MANHKSAKKRIRQTIKRTARNRHIRSTLRSKVKVVRTAIAEGNAEQAKEALAPAVRLIDMAVSKGIFHRKTGSRTISRLMRQVASL